MISRKAFESYRKAVEELAELYDSTLLATVKDIGNIIDNHMVEEDNRKKQESKMTVEEFNNLSYKERIKLFNSDYELYQKLVKGKVE